ncbi:MAG TPA: alcohol dehydrogenase catalytic domain-containing protein [Vicinamibacteria bacterium]|nr:alcohol dehydrogenase catalytic domain-containing protein [Vicinamibacteria bacterium]
MRAVWLRGGALTLADAPEPEPPPGEALVRVLLAGVCRTDLELVHGYRALDGIPGHEFVGRVEASPSAPEWVGRRVVGEINASCGGCAACRAGRRSHCERRTVLGIRGRHGAFAERLSLPVANLHAVPDRLSDEEAVFTEPLAAALEVQQQVPVETGDRVVVVGDGKLGQLVGQTLAATGCSLTVVGRHDAKLSLLAGRGIRAVDARSGSLPPGRSADLVVECTGNQEGVSLALRLVRPRGTVVLKSTYHGHAQLDLSAVVVDEVTLVGSRCGPFAPALDLLARGAVDVRRLVHARYRLADALAAFDHAARPGVLKVLIEP